METRNPVPPKTGLHCSVVVLTLNEERNLADCLQSLSGFEDIHVLDSGSTDATAEIARRFGATLATHRFESFGQQRNWAHDGLPLRHRWVLHLDADERMTAELESEIRSVVASDNSEVAGFYIAERTLLDGQWLRYAGQYPRYQARLVHRDRMRFIDHGHGQREQSSLLFNQLRSSYEHHAFSQGIEHWLRKHVGYAVREAEAVQTPVETWPALLNRVVTSHGTDRRRALKRMAERVPARPLLRWLYVLVICRGVLDGRAGWQYAQMMKVFQEMIDLCAHERQVAGSTRRAA